VRFSGFARIFGVAEMRLPEKQHEWRIGGWTLGVILCPGILRFGIGWDGDPLSLSISLPFMSLWCEHEGGKYWPWDWTILRVIIGKQEFRADLALNYWGLGISMHETDDWSIHIGRSTSNANTTSSTMTTATQRPPLIFACSRRHGTRSTASLRT